MAPKTESQILEEAAALLSSLPGGPRAYLRGVRYLADRLGVLGDLQGSGGRKRERPAGETFSYVSSLGTAETVDLVEVDEEVDRAMAGAPRRRGGRQSDLMGGNYHSVDDDD